VPDAVGELDEGKNGPDYVQRCHLIRHYQTIVNCTAGTNLQLSVSARLYFEALYPRRLIHVIASLS